MAMCLAAIPKPKFTKGKKVFLVSPTVAPQTIEVLRTRAAGFGIELRVAQSNETLEKEIEEVGDQGLMGALVQYPDVNGAVGDWEAASKKVKESGAKMVVASDLLALTMIKPPGEWGADIVCGNSQRFGKSQALLVVGRLADHAQACPPDTVARTPRSSPAPTR
jgi:glycine dehydrogenase